MPVVSNALITTMLIALFGAIGTLSRYWISGFFYNRLGLTFPWGTLAVNILGSLLLGLLMQPVLESTSVPQPLRIPLTVGFCGAFTTFSTFSYETLRYIQDGAWGLAVTNTVANFILGLLAVFAGFVLGRLINGGA